jgi:hypothetical protein
MWDRLSMFMAEKWLVGASVVVNGSTEALSPEGLLNVHHRSCTRVCGGADVVLIILPPMPAAETRVRRAQSGGAGRGEACPAAQSLGQDGVERQVERQRPRLVLTRAHRNSLSLSLFQPLAPAHLAPSRFGVPTQARLNYKPDNDGLFWMGLQDFVTHFNRLYVCRYICASSRREPLCLYLQLLLTHDAAQALPRCLRGQVASNRRCWRVEGAERWRVMISPRQEGP